MNEEDLFKDWRTYNVYYLISAVILIISIAPIGLMSSIIMSNTIDGVNLYYYSVIPGILFSIFFLYLLVDNIPHIFYGGKYAGSIFSHICFFIGITVITGSIAVFVNYKYSNTEEVCSVHTLEKKYIDENITLSSSNNILHYRINLYVDKKLREFDISPYLFEKVNGKDSLEMCIKKGYFGFDYVLRFNKI